MQDSSVAISPLPEAAPSLGLGRRLLRTTGWTLVWLGLLTLGFVAHQLWVTSFFAARNQQALAEEREEINALTEIGEAEYVRPDGSVATVITEGMPPEGAPFARIIIPSIEELRDGWTVVHGVSVADLRSGAGHMPDTPLPGQPGNSVISGHRTTYGAPFNELDTLEPGDRIEVETAIGTHGYAVREVFVVAPTDVWVTDPRDGGWLTLTTCHPEFSAAERLIVVAEMVDGPNAEAIRGQA
jgi:sortase A